MGLRSQMKKDLMLVLRSQQKNTITTSSIHHQHIIMFFDKVDTRNLQQSYGVIKKWNQFWCQLRIQ